MHPLFVEVLSRKDLSRAGELFAIHDRAIVGDLSELLATIQRISSSAHFVQRHNEQSVVEICLTRIISAIRDTNTIEENAGALVSLLESCLLHDLKPTSKDQDPPHAKIASEVVSCIFLNHSKKSVMCLAVPVAVKLLHRGNRELSRNLSSYLSLAAINNGDILAAHIQPIIDSIIGGNYALVRVLPKIYAYNREAIHEHIMGLVCLLAASSSISSTSTPAAAASTATTGTGTPNAQSSLAAGNASSSSSTSSSSKTDTSERVALLSLFALISKRAPATLEYSLPQLADCLTAPPTAYLTLQIFLDMAQANIGPLADYTGRVMAAATEVAPQPATGSMLSLAAEFLGVVAVKAGSSATAGEVVRFLVGQLSNTSTSTSKGSAVSGGSGSGGNLDLGTTIALLRQTKTVAEVWPCVLESPPPSVMGAIRAAVERQAASSTTVQSYLAQLGAIAATLPAATATATSSSRTSASELAGGSSYKSSQQNFSVSNSSRLTNGFTPAVNSEGGSSSSSSFINTTTSAFNGGGGGRSAGSRLTSNGFHILHRSIPRLHVVSGHHHSALGGGGSSAVNSGGGSGHGNSQSGGNSLHMHRSLNALVACSSGGASSSSQQPQGSNHHHHPHQHLFQHNQSHQQQQQQQANNSHHYHSRYAANRMSVESMTATSAPNSSLTSQQTSSTAAAAAASASSQRSSQKSASSSYLLALQEKELRTGSGKNSNSGGVGGGGKSHSYHPNHYHQHHTITGSSVDSQLQQTASISTSTTTTNKPLTSSSSSSSHYNLRNSEKEMLAAFGGGGGGGRIVNSSSINGLGTSTTAAAAASKAAKTTSGTLSSAESSVSFGQTTTVPSSAHPQPPHSAPAAAAHSEHSKSSGSINQTGDSNRMSVFEPYPMRDAVQHFCEKHIDKIKAYMTKVFVKIPQPVKITIEERGKSKKVAKIYFNCQTKSEHCLYRGASHFVMRTKSSRLWIHLMFLALQARASSALCTREPSVHSLKNCWETLKLDNRTFLTLVTSSFPSAKDQEVLIEELRAARYFDVFHFNALVQAWGCFLCNHPDKATGFLGRVALGGGGVNSEVGNDLDGGPRLLLPGDQEHPPVIEGTLKEKKGGKWKLFRRWRTRYFTLSGVHLYRDEVSGCGNRGGSTGVQLASSASSAFSAASASASASKASRFAAAVGSLTAAGGHAIGGSLHRLSNLRSHSSASASGGNLVASSSAASSSKTTSSFLQQNGSTDRGGGGNPHQVELLGKVQSVRALGNTRGRSIPKAFEIFTSEKTYVLKAPNNQHNQEWMQCLSIAMAHNSSSSAAAGQDSR